MNNLSLLFVAFLFFQFTLFAQEGWFYLNPYPQGNPINDVCIVDVRTGFAVGNNGTILQNAAGLWLLLESPTNSRLTSICNVGGNIWIVGYNGTVIWSTDYGQSWNSQVTNSDDMLNSVYFINENVGWGVGEDGIMIHTTNGGVDWVRESGLWTVEDLYDIQFINENVGWISGREIVLKTTDAGNTWELITNSLFSRGCYSLQFFNQDTGWVVSGPPGILLKTTNGGNTWIEYYAGVNIHCRDIFFLDENIGYVAGSGDNGYGGYISKTTDGGENWVEMQVHNYLGLSSVEFLNGFRGWSVGSAGIIVETTNGGGNWVEQSIRLKDINLLHSTFFINENIGWITGSFDGDGWYGGSEILKTIDGGHNWNSQWIHTGLPKNVPNSIYFVDENTGWAVGGNYNQPDLILKTTNGGDEWIDQSTSEYQNYYSVFFIDSSTGWVVGCNWPNGNGKILKTTNGGNDWESKLNGISFQLFSVYFTDLDNGIVVGENGIILKSENGGDSWNIISSGTSETLNSVFYSSPNIVWIVGNNGTILKSINGGSSWFALSSNSSSLLFSAYFSDDFHGWVVGSWGEILYTSNSGNNWNKQESHYGGWFYSVCFINNTIGWVVGDNGTILNTTNGGVSFIEEKEIDEIPIDYHLSHNFPNPFNPSTKIKYSIPQSSNVVIKVFDILGKEIETLVNEEKPVGTYELTWYAEGLPSGVYFYRLQTGDFVQTKKMVLLR